MNAPSSDNAGELFPTESVQMDSPRLAWIKRHAVVTYYSNIEPACWFAGFQEWWPKLKGADFFAEETGYNGDTRCTEGPTEDAALAALATRWEIPLWNEDPAAPEHGTTKGKQ